MTVKSILDLKGREVVTVSPDMSMVEAAKALSANRIGAVVLADADKVIYGILSERDIVRAIANEGPAILDKAISEFMTPHVHICRESHTVNEVMRSMTMGRFRHLPVERDGKLVGIISIGDVVKRRIEEAEREAEEIRTYIATA